MQNTGNGGKIAIMGAIITAVAGIITAVVSISGPLLDKRMAIEATQTREAFVVAATHLAGSTNQMTATPTPEIPTTEGVEPTQPEKSALAADPTVTQAPVSTQTSAKPSQPKATSTPATKMLKVGEAWNYSSGISVTLTKIEFPAANEVHLHFTFTNQSKKVMNITLDHNRDVTLTDDKGTVYNWATAFNWGISIYPATNRNDEVKKRGDVSRATYFIVKLNVPGMGTATWKQ